MKFRKKPVVIEAFRVPFTGDDVYGHGMIAGFFLAHGFKDWEYFSEGYGISTLEGTMRADPGDWIIRGVKGEFYPCKPDIFEATYEAVEE